MAITIKDVAHQLGVSEATVSLACNNSPLVNQKTKERVLETAKEMGYTPNMIAKSLATSKTNTIGIVIPDIHIVFYADLLKTVDKIATKHGYSILVAMSNNNPEIEEKIVQSFVSRRIEGVLVVPTNTPTPSLWAYRKALKNYNIPVVYLSSNINGVDNIFYVMSDLRKGTCQLVNYLFDLGHRDVVFIGGDVTVPTTYLRRNGFIEAYEKRGYPYKEEFLISCENIHYAEAVSATKKLLASKLKFTAICAMNDEMALGVVNTLLTTGYKVPEDISVVGYDNTLFSVASAVEITTMDQNLDLMCETAFDMLYKLIQKTELKSKQVFIEPIFIERDTAIRIV